MTLSCEARPRKKAADGVQGAGTPTPPNVRAGNIARLPDVLRDLGLDAPAMLRSAGLCAEVLDDVEALLPLAAVDELFHLVETQTRCDHIGLLLGRLPTDLGLPSYLLFNAPDLRTGIGDVVTLIALIHEGGGFSLGEFAGLATLRYSTVAPSLRCAHHVTDCALAQMQGALEKYCGPHFRATEVRLPRRRPADLGLYRMHFGSAKLVFDASEAAIDFPAAWLASSSPSADREVYKFLKSRFGHFAKARVEPLRPRLERILGPMVKEGPVSIERISAKVGQSPRQIRERLKTEGVTFATVLKHARHVAALQMLEHTNLSIGAIAIALNYADASAFTRAFKQCTGVPPGHWRGLPAARRSTADAA